ncbi:hypothetical protein Tco_0731143 [Tanacetum coccineum]
MVVTLPFLVNLYHDGVFQVNPLQYVNFDSKVIDDVSFDEYNGYDIMEMIDEELHPKKLVSHVDSDSDVEINHPLNDVAHVIEQFEHEDEGNVNIPRMTTYDPWLNKLVGNGTFIGQIENPNPNLHGRFLLDVEDDDEQVESKFKAKKNVSYPSFSPDTSWNKCKLVLGIRFESPQQLKHMFANYGVQHGYQLWYMQQDHNKLLVFCGKDVSEGKCVSLKGKKPKTDDNEECETSKQGSKKDDGRKVVNEIISKAVKERWDKKKDNEKKGSLNKGVAATSIESVFLIKVEEIKMLDEKAHERLVERNPNSWCRAYFEKDRCSAAFENGI